MAGNENDRKADIVMEARNQESRGDGDKWAGWRDGEELGMVSKQMLG